MEQALKDRFMARLVSTIDTPGGHMLVCLLVILLGAAFAWLKLPKSEDLIVAGSATLFQAMRGRGSENHIPVSGRTETLKVETSTDAVKPGDSAVS
jgi:hypothetical protein